MKYINWPSSMSSIFLKVILSRSELTIQTVIDYWIEGYELEPGRGLKLVVRIEVFFIRK